MNLQDMVIGLQDNFLKELENSSFKEENNKKIRKQLKKKKVKENMKRGYLEMGSINLKMAVNDFNLDNKIFFIYEARLAESD